jgi:hypothetical protein
MRFSVAWRAAALLAVSVAVVAVILAVSLPTSFFEDFGWAAGPGAWAACAAVTARVLRLPLLPVLVGAALAGVPSLIGVLLDSHWAGAPLGLIIFGLWCGRLAAQRSTITPAGPRPLAAS